MYAPENPASRLTDFVRMSELVVMATIGLLLGVIVGLVVAASTGLLPISMC